MPDADEREFHLKEYESLRQEIIAQGSKYDQLKLILLGACGAIYSWIFSNMLGSISNTACTKFDHLTTTIILLIPVFVCIIIGFIAFAYWEFFEKVGSYERILESYLGRSRLGWEAHAYNRTTDDSKNRQPISQFDPRNFLDRRRDHFWQFVLGSSLLLSILASLYLYTFPVCNTVSTDIPASVSKPPSPQE
jgi:hypothetical protein